MAWTFCIFYFVYLQKELANNPNCPHMCAYKLVTVKFKWTGLQGKMESYIQKVYSNIWSMCSGGQNMNFYACALTSLSF